MLVSMQPPLNRIFSDRASRGYCTRARGWLYLDFTPAEGAVRMSLGQNGASLQDLLRREPLGSEEWIRRLETRKERLVPHINSLPLTRLGDHPLIGYHRQLILQADVPIRSNDLSLSL